VITGGNYLAHLRKAFATTHVGIIASPGLVKETKDIKNMATIYLTGIFS